MHIEHQSPLYGSALGSTGEPPPVGPSASSTRSSGEAAFRIDVCHEHDAVRVTPVGEMDLATVSQVDARLRALRDAGTRRLVLDLRELTFMDSTGLWLSRRWHRDAVQGGADFALVPGSPAVQRVFEMQIVPEELPFVVG